MTSWIACLCALLCLTGCAQGPVPGPDGAGPAPNPPVSNSQPAETDPAERPAGPEEEQMLLTITVGDKVLTAIPEDNSSAEAFLALLKETPITVKMSDYGGMEKVGPLGTSLPRNDTQLTVGAGDVILYQGDQITIYYGTNTWSFTRLAVIEGATREGLLEVLGEGDAEVTFFLTGR